MWPFLYVHKKTISRTCRFPFNLTIQIQLTLTTPIISKTPVMRKNTGGKMIVFKIIEKKKIDEANFYFEIFNGLKIDGTPVFILPPCSIPTTACKILPPNKVNEADTRNTKPMNSSKQPMIITPVSKGRK